MVLKQIYASHYFWTALELRVLVPDAARQGFLVCERQSEPLGRSVGGRRPHDSRQGPGEARSGMEAVLKITKTTLEKQAG